MLFEVDLQSPPLMAFLGYITSVVSDIGLN